VRVLVPGVGSIGGFTYGDIVPIKVYRTKNNFRYAAVSPPRRQ
jgi:hypothetical protein